MSNHTTNITVKMVENSVAAAHTSEGIILFLAIDHEVEHMSNSTK